MMTVIDECSELRAKNSLETISRREVIANAAKEDVSNLDGARAAPPVPRINFPSPQLHQR